jgi:hypothetical protein
VLIEFVVVFTQTDICIHIQLTLHVLFNTAQVMTPAPRHCDRHDMYRPMQVQVRKILFFATVVLASAAAAAACPHATRYQSLSSTA